MLEWREIVEFPGYSVSNFGDIRNDVTERLMRQTMNTNGIMFVGLMRGGIQCKRSVAPLVAAAFVFKPRADFKTPVHLDNNRENLNAKNLAYRPLWFARLYTAQFSEPPILFTNRVEDVDTRAVYDSAWSAAITHGIIVRDVIRSTTDWSHVRITGQRFRAIYDEKSPL